MSHSLPPAAVARFLSKVGPADANGCQEFTGGKCDRGYGYVHISGSFRNEGGAERDYAHRVAWRIANDCDVPDGLSILHSCDNPPCCNTLHLFAGTPKENTQDMIRKGRRAGGQVSKFTQLQIREIRRRATAGTTKTAIAKEHGVSVSRISQITNGQHTKQYRKG